MSIAPQHTAIMAYLKSLDEGLDEGFYAKALELRSAVRGWLSYIPQTFPHYTRHTIEHSDEIVLQISKLLFRNDDSRQPVIQLSAAEAYVLVAAAYLHDAGMVAADKEKLEIITSNEEWKKWTSGSGGGAKRWREIEEIRRSDTIPDETKRHFVADLQTRFLLAEFLRRSHHLRAADVIKQYQDHLGRFAFGDPMMQRTIADVCIAHGLRHYELEDRERYPERRDIQGYAVNVRLVAILLRLGDLLDMSYDRACPLLMNAANPLPADSLAHWEQYKRIVHRSTTPNRIEITAECEKQEEHRVLQDWCQWIVEEVRQAKVLINRAELHNDWQPPIAAMDSPDATIIIRPAQGATYIPSKWTFELDHEAVFQRLIRDVYDNPLVFIRELVQNALDANRSQMYADLIKDGVRTPEYPTQVDENRRQRYPVRLSLETREIKNSLSGEVEERQVLTIDDSGIGMDREIIQRYFLQVGRSYYTTDEFRRNFRFIPTSRFGIGFLSVFAVSDYVVVETYKPSSKDRDEPLRLTLTGPRSYLLTESSQRQTNGTRIEVLLREPLPQGKLTGALKIWCRRVEFPVLVDDLGTQTTINAERADQFTYEVLDVTKEGNKFAVRAFPVNRPGIEGEIYVFVGIDEAGESWDKWEYARHEYPKAHPQAMIPNFPAGLICLHGIALISDVDNYYEISGGPLTARIDYRSDRYNPTVSRGLYRSEDWLSNPEIQSRVEEILGEHLATSSRANSAEGWKYKQRLANNFSLSSFWSSLPGMVPVYKNGQIQLQTLKDTQSSDVITTILSIEQLTSFSREDKSDQSVLLRNIGPNQVCILGNYLGYLSEIFRGEIFANRLITDLKRLTPNHLAIDWSRCEEKDYLFAGNMYDQISLGNLSSESLVGISIRSFIGTYQTQVILNTKHAFSRWLQAVKTSSINGKHDFNQNHFKNLMALVQQVVMYGGEHIKQLNSYLNEWMKIPNLPEELYPPLVELTPEMFTLKAETND